MSETEEHPHPHPEERVPPKYLSFLREIRNTDLTWTFQIMGALRVTGKIVDFLWDDRGIPVTLMVLPKGANRVKPTEIPWVCIQTITLDSGGKK